MAITTVVICGCGHSGTSLLVNMFAAHPAVFSPLEETRMFFRRTAPVRLAWFKLNALLRGRRIMVEKTPRHILVLDRVRRIAPNTKIIMIVRDGRDVAASLFKRTGEIEAGVQRWVDANAIVRSEEASPDAIRLRYEDLITQPEQELRRLCAFVGMPFDLAMLDYHKKPRMWFGAKTLKPGAATDGEQHNQLRNWQINQPIFDGRGKWREVLQEPPHLLTHGLGQELMMHFGYCDDH